MYNICSSGRGKPLQIKDEMAKAIDDGLKVLQDHKVMVNDLYLVWDVSMFDIIKESGMCQGIKMYFVKNMQPIKVGHFNNKGEWLENE